MDKKMKILLSATAVCLLLITAVSAIFANTATAEPDTSHEPASSISSQTATVWTVGEYNGKLAVYEANANIPIEIYSDINIKDFPTLDQQLLEEGITVYSNQELQQLLEDYTS